MATEIAIVRHGNAMPADDPAQDKFRPLSETGIAQAQAVQLSERPKVVFSSPALRTKRTAEIILSRGGESRPNIIEVSALSLHQWNPGSNEVWEAALRAGVSYQGGECSLTEALEHFGPGSAEVEALGKLSTDAWETIQPQLPSDGLVLIVGHGIFTPAMLHFGAGLNGPFVTNSFPECGIFTVTL